MGHSLAPRLGAAASFACLILAAPGVQAAGTEAQREACMSDAFRLCTMAMPDEKRVENCLRAATPQLSRACYNVFYPEQAAAPNQITRGQARERVQPSVPMRPQTPSMPQMPPGPDDDE